MTADKLLQHCQWFDIRLFVQGRDLGIDAPRSGPNAWLAAELSAHKTELIALLDPPASGGQEPPRRATEECATVLTQGRLCHYCGSDDIVQTTGAPKPHYARLTCKSCGRGIGFAPKPVEFAPGFKLHFGIYSGNTLAQIWETDRGRDYLKWAATNINKPRIREMITFFLDHASRMPSDGADDGDEIPF